MTAVQPDVAAAEAAAALDAATTEERPLDRDSIVAVAGHLVDAEGPESLTLTSIADALGVTQPALYRHIGSLPELWRELGIVTRHDLAQALAEASVGRAGRDAVRSVGHAWRRFGTSHPGRYRSSDRHAVAGDPDLEAAANHTLDVVSRALRGFDFDDVARRDAADAVRSALHGFVSFEISDGHPDPHRVDAAFEQMLDFLCTAFEAASATPANRPTDVSRSQPS